MTLRKREKKVSASPNPGRGGGEPPSQAPMGLTVLLYLPAVLPRGGVCVCEGVIFIYSEHENKTNNKKKPKPKIQRSNRLGSKSRRPLYGTGNAPKGEKSVPKGGHCYVTFLL